MDEEGGFVFADAYRLPEGQKSFVGALRRGISDADHLLRAVDEALRFPGYFGENWNALWDCISDLTWLDEPIVVLQHADTPSLPPDDLKIYVDILRDAVAAWTEREGRTLVVVFPTASRSDIQRALRRRR